MKQMAEKCEPETLLKEVQPCAKKCSQVDPSASRFKVFMTNARRSSPVETVTSERGMAYDLSVYLSKTFVKAMKGVLVRFDRRALELHLAVPAVTSACSDVLL